jgi:hypothetical protein
MNNFYLKEQNCVGYPRFYKLYQKLFKKIKPSDKCVAWALMREYSKWAKMQCIYENCIDMGIRPPETVNDFIERNPFGPKDEAAVMRTSWDGSTVGGRALCQKAGFERTDNLLEWRKEKKDGITESKRSEEEGNGKEAQGQA